MNYQAKQDELDVKKWLESERKGGDTCGEYDYCACCDKNADYPCAVAAEKSAKAAKSSAAKKPAAKKTAAAAKPATAAKKPAAKTASAKTTKTAAKK